MHALHASVCSTDDVLAAGRDTVDVAGAAFVVAANGLMPLVVVLLASAAAPSLTCRVGNWHSCC